MQAMVLHKLGGIDESSTPLSLETLPVPLDDRIILKQEPARLMAVIRYSGTWSRSRYQEKEARLVSLIGERELKTVGEPVFARYNPPFTLWFLRRNEVLIQVERSQN